MKMKLVTSSTLALCFALSAFTNSSYATTYTSTATSSGNSAATGSLISGSYQYASFTCTLSNPNNQRSDGGMCRVYHQIDSTHIEDVTTLYVDKDNPVKSISVYLSGYENYYVYVWRGDYAAVGASVTATLTNTN